MESDLCVGRSNNKLGKYNLFCGLCWHERIAYATVTLGFPNRGLRDGALRRLKEKGFIDLRGDFYEYELCFCEEIDWRNMTSFSRKLSVLTDKWVSAFKTVGGVHAFDS
jgi:hypothetical protein